MSARSKSEWAKRLAPNITEKKNARNGAFASDSQAWIAERMCIKNAANVSRIVHRMNPSPLEKEVSEELCRFIMKENEH